MNEREALKMALEVFGGSDWHEEIVDSAWADKANKAIIAIREALAQQEHVSYSGNGTAGREADVKPTGFFFQMPPQRTWVGLTDEEIKSEAKYFCHGWYSQNPERLVLLVKIIKAKLREKNGG